MDGGRVDRSNRLVDLERVHRNGVAIPFVDNQTPGLCLATVRENGVLVATALV